MKTKKSLAFSVVMAVALLSTLVLACVAFTACGATKFNVTWNVAEHITITDIKVDDEALTERPASIEEGKTLTFKVTAAEGYSINKVTGASLKSSGVYTVKISKDTEINITEKKVVQNLTVTGFDNTKQYFVGDEIDLTDVVVKATYIDGDVTVTDYTVSTKTFQGGERSVTFSYGGQEKSFDIPVVEYKVTIDLNGGTLSDELAATYATAAEAKIINNYSNEKGIVTFTYIDLETTIKLPTKDDIEKEYYEFVRFNGDTLTSLTSKTAQSVNMTVVWEFQPVKVNEVKIEARDIETEGEDDTVTGTVQKPYLVITGTFNGATEAALYLHEGNKNINMNGTKVTQQGDDKNFTLEFDLTQLSADPSFNGAWMDIRFNATVDSKTESMPLHITNPNLFEIDLSQKVRVGDYNYLFATYTDTNGDTTLKIYYNDTFYEYEISIDDTDADDPKMIVEGKMLKSDYNGGKITISWWITSESPSDESPIDEDGNFRVEIALNDIPTGSNGYAHVTIVGANGESYGGTSTNFFHAGAKNKFETLSSKVGEITNAIRYEAANGIAYYIGYAWEGLMVYARNEKVLLGTATLVKDGEEDAEKVYLALSGRYSTTAYADAEAAEEDIKEGLQFDAQTLGGYTTVTAAYTPDVIVNEDGTFEIRIELQSATAGSTVFFHKCLGFNGETTVTDNNLGTGNVTPEIGSTVTANGLTYTIGNASTLSESWQRSLVIVDVTEA